MGQRSKAFQLFLDVLRVEPLIESLAELRLENKMSAMKEEPDRQFDEKLVCTLVVQACK